MNSVELVVSRFKEGYPCSEAVLSAYGEQLGLGCETALRVAGGFSGGMGYMAETCGAVTGAFMVIGLKYGAISPEDQQAREKTHKLVREFASRFRSRNGSIRCKELLGCDIGTSEGLKFAEEKGCFSTLCPKLVKDAAEILEEILRQYRCPTQGSNNGLKLTRNLAALGFWRLYSADLAQIASCRELCEKFEWKIPAEYNVAVDIVDRHAYHKGKLALFYEDEAGHEERYTFWEIKNLSNQFANLLRSLGVKKGDRIAINLPQRPETAIAHVGVYKLGAIAVPLSILYGPDALKQMLKDSRAKVIVVEGKHKEKVNKIRNELEALEHVIVVGEDEGEIQFWGDLLKASRRLDVVRTSAEDPALILFTGGTTGPPKGVLFAHRGFLGYLATMQMSYDLIFDEGSIFWTPSDWAWGAGLIDLLLPAWWFGRPVLGYNGRFNPEKALELMEKYGVTNAFLVPTALKRMMQVESPGTKYDLDLRVIASAAEPVSPEILNWAREEFGVPVNEFYGLTEVGHLVGNCSKLWDVRPGSMGKAYPWREVSIFDDAGSALPPGEVGQIAVKKGDPAMFLGYWGNPEETEERFLGDWMLTGDLAKKDEDGYFWFKGRLDDLIKSAGYRIGPWEVEEAIREHPAVADVAAVGSPDEIRGSIVKAFIKLRPGHTPSQELKEEIQNQVKENLAAYKYPREIEFTEELPTTAHGKIDRKALRRLEEERKRER